MKTRDYTPLKSLSVKIRTKSHFVTTEKEAKENFENWKQGIDRMIAHRKKHGLQ